MRRALIGTVAILGLAAAPASAHTLAMIDGSGALRTFDSATPGTLSDPVACPVIVRGIDVRPRDGGLYGVAPGTPGHLVRIDPATCQTTYVGTNFTNTANATEGVDFNPTVDRLRIVNDTDDNFRVNPNNGTLAGTDTAITPAGLTITALAYDRPTAPDALNTTKTTLFGIDLSADQLVRIGDVDGAPSSPNAGVATPIGPLGVATIFGNTGFDIAPDGTAYYAATTTGDKSHLFRINLATGAATEVGLIGDGSPTVNGLAVLITGAVGFASPSASVAESAGTAHVTVTRAAPTDGPVKVAYATADGTATAGADYTAASGELAFAAGETQKAIDIPVANDATQEPTESFDVVLSQPAIPKPTAPLGAITRASVVIGDDDAPPPPAVTVTTAAPTPPDTTPPVVLTLPVSMRLASRMTFSFACSEACSGTARLRKGTKTEAKASLKLTKPSVANVTLKLSSATLKALRKAHARSLSLRLEITDNAGNATSSTATITLKR